MRHLLFCLLLSVSLGTYAENWLPIDKSVSLDIDSIKLVNETTKHVTWRKSEIGKTYTHASSVDCSVEIIRTTGTSITEDNPVLSRGGATELDFVTKTRMEQGKLKPLHSWERSMEFRLPTPYSAEGRLIARVCDIDTEVKSRGARAFYSQSCNTKPTPTHYMCSMDDQAYLEYHNLISRLSFGRAACGMTQEAIDNIKLGWIMSLVRCREGQDKCRSKITSLAYEVGEDISRKLRGEKCTYLAGAQATIDENEANEAAWDRYRKCITVKVVKLDDGASSADVIARGVFAQCRGQAPVDSSFDPGQSVIDSITGLILEQRQAKRRPTKPNRTAPKVAG